ncbi:MAG: recombination mediator RecR [Acholeplasmataceae bacterium]|nr:recombination mediator RecR [Acholeplasmataceae bacterium]
MMPQSLKKVIDGFSKLPGIGEKTAERLALFMATQMDDHDIILFAEDIRMLKASLKTCPVCHMLTDEVPCPVCSDVSRDTRTLMVVAEAKDVFALEKMNSYQGLYHVLGGVIDFSRGITDKDLSVDLLEKRLSGIDEMIIATSGTVEGETTAKYLKSLFTGDQLRITRLAYGLPVGTDLKYADLLTLAKAVENRQKY